jgi:hypothetical protein
MPTFTKPVISLNKPQLELVSAADNPDHAPSLTTRKGRDGLRGLQAQTCPLGMVLGEAPGTHPTRNTQTLAATNTP